ncbi:MAG: FkbM family methyltransferase [Blastocatellia bacterium]
MVTLVLEEVEKQQYVEQKMRNIVERFKLVFRGNRYQELMMKPDVTCPVDRFGSDYGGWDVVTTELHSQSVVYSFGIGEDATFDIALIDKYGLTVHAFDPTPRSIEWVKRQGFSDRFIMHEYGIASFDGNVSFSPPENPDHVSHTILDRPSTKSNAITVPVKKLATIIQELGHAQIDVLKMDIEGAEYEVIQDIYRSKIRPGQILVEFHHRFPGVGIKKTRDAVDSIKSMGYLLFSVSPTQEEYCFIRDSG